MSGGLRTMILTTRNILTVCAAWIQANIRSRLRESGKPIDFQDTQIAAIAVSNGMILVTRNTKHFEPIQAVSPLLVENWFE